MDPVTERLSAPARARIEALGPRWALPGDHPLSALHGARLGPYTLVVLLGPKSNVGSRTFQLLAADASGAVSEEPVALGLHNQGPYPAYNWIEITSYDPQPHIGTEQHDLRAEDLELPFFELVSALVPPGGHIMVEYDSPAQRPTERVLTLGYPEAASPTGYLLFLAGCRSYKNWHISEGWKEGPRKLQGFKPWNEDIAAEKTRNLLAQLNALLDLPPNARHGEWDAIARSNAEAIRLALQPES